MKDEATESKASRTGLASTLSAFPESVERTQEIVPIPRFVNHRQ